MAEVSWLARFQAVRLPRTFRIRQDDVRIQRQGAAIILEPTPIDWGWLDGIAGPVDPDFEQATGYKVVWEKRPGLGHFK